ncbi:MAG TPA: DUF805 domain-containing protein [Phenylobacterium sp.]|uniref:DUF805 domain-containing protein n=1 Tax=Phenylobacterium sp. TaxID=1871053 RepID=UPI002BC1224A|nr:DUF805 domain-containing protein [Phenylobacterium sp.]HSV03416.1 DUF805 domain-containing protein [Phenylobacterium sp.]
MRGILNGRLGRRQYWAILAANALVCVGAALVLELPSGAAASLVWLAMAAGRLHDLGRSGWWAAGLLVFEAGAVTAASTVGPLMVAPIAYLGALLLVACSLWLGVAEGEPGENRFGPPPGNGRASRTTPV